MSKESYFQRVSDGDTPVEELHDKAVGLWLKENPRIGCLNGGGYIKKYYRIYNGKAVSVNEFESQKN